MYIHTYVYHIGRFILFCESVNSFHYIWLPASLFHWHIPFFHAFTPERLFLSYNSGFQCAYQPWKPTSLTHSGFSM